MTEEMTEENIPLDIILDISEYLLDYDRFKLSLYFFGINYIPHEALREISLDGEISLFNILHQRGHDVERWRPVLLLGYLSVKNVYHYIIEINSNKLSDLWLDNLEFMGLEVVNYNVFKPIGKDGDMRGKGYLVYKNKKKMLSICDTDKDNPINSGHYLNGSIVEIVAESKVRDLHLTKFPEYVSSIKPYQPPKGEVRYTFIEGMVYLLYSPTMVVLYYIKEKIRDKNWFEIEGIPNMVKIQIHYREQCEELSQLIIDKLSYVRVVGLTV